MLAACNLIGPPFLRRLVPAFFGLLKAVFFKIRVDFLRFYLIEIVKKLCASIRAVYRIDNGMRSFVEDDVLGFFRVCYVVGNEIDCSSVGIVNPADICLRPFLRLELSRSFLANVIRKFIVGLYDFHAALEVLRQVLGDRLDVGFYFLALEAGSGFGGCGEFGLLRELCPCLFGPFR